MMESVKWSVSIQSLDYFSENMRKPFDLYKRYVTDV